ncbi:dTDP-glucose 4,6-dehydratase [Leptospira biflexa serovar Patoc strain 'Patoc 1 (Ames)']|uniref:dTDP-glucose 4,6-dehydratase n=1 Tax=Leptospira biflexa serovar Patoc (strain Patoc 1 / ATCC 23582 / Paris) TaxID=456481 RepID=B0SSQ1_LEPBP|nr:dTDP-glucose 4,6-dehydratase [Leptospira biflexa]ABZ94486.1 dTDP-glucose 4,6-dehydratase [Leptospira biflexa serovar Patoc strain 'Patoc 1 (Ames)']ABZ98141.1 dTDP-glucose 4,6-dehydratase [Leptospira biflexa serovar Patoc strain 'Patoc 1 (Paris)']
MEFKNVLVTGSAGFIGSNFVPYFLETHPHVHVVSLDKITYAGNLDNLSSIISEKRHTFVNGDICDAELVGSLFETYKFDLVVHFAAESHVDNSIINPKIFLETNVIGTFQLLQTAYSTWFSAPFQRKPGFEAAKFIHISTDEVFGSLGESGFFTEDSPYQPNSPYSASKASSDHIVRSYYHTYGLPMIITNCSNNYGPKQHNEKLIPTIIRNALEDKNIPIYGTGMNIRDWLFVMDHVKGIEKVILYGKLGETYNIGGNNELTNNQVVNVICNHLDKVIPRGNGKSYSELIMYVSDRPGHDKRYAIDATKMKKDLNWIPEETFETGIVKTIDWYLKKYKN